MCHLKECELPDWVTKNHDKGQEVVFAAEPLVISYEQWAPLLGEGCSLLWVLWELPCPASAPRPLLLTGSMVKQARFQSKELPSFFSWW